MFFMYTSLILRQKNFMFRYIIHFVPKPKYYLYTTQFNKDKKFKQHIHAADINVIQLP